MADAEVIAGQLWTSRYTELQVRVTEVVNGTVKFKALNMTHERPLEDFLHNYRR